MSSVFIAARGHKKPYRASQMERVHTKKLTLCVSFSVDETYCYIFFILIKNAKITKLFKLYI